MPTRMSEYQRDLLRRSLEDGEDQVAGTFEMLTGRSVDAHSMSVSVHPSSELMSSDVFGFGTVALVRCEVQGDMTGDFLLVQRQSDLVSWTRIMQTPENPEPGEDTRRRRRNRVAIPWLNETQTPGLKEAMADLLGESANILFGVFFATLYEHYGLATFQGIPRVDSHDNEQTRLQEALWRNCTDSDIAALIELDYTIADEHLRLWLVLLPSSQGVEALINPPQRKGKGLRGLPSRKPTAGENHQHWPGGALIPTRIGETTASNNMDYRLSENAFEYEFRYEIDFDLAI